jgi:uncharacterized protein
MHMKPCSISSETRASTPLAFGIMGFSRGGMIALLASSDALTRQYIGDRLRFAAHLGLYPICWRHELVLAGKDKYIKPGVYGRATGRPVHILAGEKDDYDEPASCDKFLAALPSEVRRHFSLTMYPGGTFGWDSRAGSSTYAAGAHKNKGESSTSSPTREVRERPLLYCRHAATGRIATVNDQNTRVPT